MAINYNIYKTSGALSEKTQFYARFISHKVIELDEIADKIDHECSLTPADVKGCMTALAKNLVDGIKSGCTVHLNGLGYFTPEIKGEIHLDKSGNETLKDAMIQNIKFYPEKDLLMAFGEAEFKKVSWETKAAKPLSDDEIQQAVDELLAAQSSFSASEFIQKTGMSSSSAYKVLKSLEKAGTIQNTGTLYAKRYERGE